MGFLKEIFTILDKNIVFYNMIINNEKKIISIKLRKLFYAIVTGTIITLFFTLEVFRNGVFGLPNKWAAIIILLLYIGYYYYHWFINPYYIYFSDEGETITFKFYATRTAGSKKMIAEISKTAFHHYEIKKETINQKVKLTLFQATNKGIFKYPPIYLSALSQQEKENLLYSLNKYIQKN